MLKERMKEMLVCFITTVKTPWIIYSTLNSINNLFMYFDQLVFLSIHTALIVYLVGVRLFLA